MRENTIRTIWEQDRAVINGWLHLPTSWSAEVMAHQGFDSLTVDMQHGMLGFETMLTMLQAISTTSTMPLARVNWNEPGIIMKVLDAGAMGIICPMVNTRAEAESFIGACRYHPDGYRSLGPTRARLYGGADYAAKANETVITIAMIETDVALGNLDEILSAPGLDAIYIGPGDLSLCLRGVGGIDIDDPVFIEAVDAILASCKKHGVIPGIHTESPEYALKMIDKGFRFVTVSTDTNILRKAATAIVDTMRGRQSVKEQPAAPY